MPTQSAAEPVTCTTQLPAFPVCVIHESWPDRPSSNLRYSKKYLKCMSYASFFHRIFIINRGFDTKCRVPGKTESWAKRYRSHAPSIPRDLQRSGQAGHALDPVAAAPGFEAPGQPLNGARVGVAGRAHLDGGGAGQQIFDHIFRSRDAAHADNWNADGAGGLVNHAQGDGLDGRAGEAAGDVAQPRAAGLGVNRHGQKGIGQADHVGPGLGGNPGHVGDGGHVGRELDDQRAGAGGLGAGHKVFERTWIGAEGHAAGVDVGAGDIQLVSRDSRGLIEPLDDRDILAHRVAEDVDDDVAAGIAAERRQLAADELLHAHILEPDSVEHSSRSLDDARRGVAGHRFHRDALGDQGADPLQMHDLFKLDAIAEGAAGGKDRVGQLQAGQRHFHLGFHARLSSFVSGQWTVISQGHTLMILARRERRTGA